MDATFLRLYEAELQHLREMGSEFAREFPKIAGRLGLDAQACADPYVERLLEGFSFLAARVQLKIDASFPQFTEHLLDLVHPLHLAPTPSMAVVQFQPDLDQGSLAAGYVLPRDTALRSVPASGELASCEFRTAQATTLWPLSISRADYLAYRGEMGGLDLRRFGPVKAALRMRLRSGAGLPMRALQLDALSLHLRGGDAVAARLHEEIHARALGVVAMPADESAAWIEPLGAEAIRQPGFEVDEGLLPACARTFSGYRLLQEYFAFPQRFLFTAIDGLQRAVRRCAGNELDVVILFDDLQPALERGVTADQLALHCTPAINLFPKRLDRVAVTTQQTEFHVVADRTRPADYEVYRISGVTGYGSGAQAVQQFRPFYRAHDLDAAAPGAYYQVRREPRATATSGTATPPRAARSAYRGHECFISLVDPAAAPLRSDLRQLGIEALCTNRDLPLGIALGAGATDFTLDSAAPVKAVRCVAGPTAPAESHAGGANAWRIASHLSLNHLLVGDGFGRGAESLRETLRLYVRPGDPIGLRQVEGIVDVAARPIVRRIPGPGPLAHGRGVEVSVTFDETAYEGTGVLVLGAVLERFLARIASINSFTETVLRSTTRGELVRWPARSGLCATL